MDMLDKAPTAATRGTLGPSCMRRQCADAIVRFISCTAALPQSNSLMKMGVERETSDTRLQPLETEEIAAMSAAGCGQRF